MDVKKNFIDTPEGAKRYKKSMMLYERIEHENSHTVDVNGIILGYLEFGSPDGIPLIWSHGTGNTGYEIINVQAGLVEAGYRVIAIDYRGHGKTQIGVTDYNTSLYHIADDIAALMDHLGIAKAVVGGLSKGGWVAAAFYDTYPQRVLGLLLEDGGSFSKVRLIEDIQCQVVQAGLPPYSTEALKKLFDTTTRFETRLEGLKVVWAAYSPAVKANTTLDYITGLLSLLRQGGDGTWFFHCDVSKLIIGVDAGRSVETGSTGATLYSRLPLMQQSQELMNPFVVFRRLDVPMHIIDPDSLDDWLPVRHQNEELQALHPDWIVHEVYDYEHSPHEAHIDRPERFIESAKALLKRVTSQSGLR